MNSNGLKSICLNNKFDHLELLVNLDEKQSVLKFESHWLRFNCQSGKSREPSTGERTIVINNVPTDLKIKSAMMENDSIRIVWDESSCQSDSLIPIEFLLNNSPSLSSIDFDKHYLTLDTIFFFDYNSFFTGDIRNEAGIFEWLKCLAEYGLCMVKNVPTKENMLRNLVEMIAPLQRTIYGEMFDVRIDVNPLNLAFSASPLEFHNDLIYYESPPGIQFLHCLKFDESVVGGETLFVDGFQIAEKFRQEHPKLFDVLTRIPASFQKTHDYMGRKIFIQHSKPHIVVNQRQKVIGVNWAPANEGPLRNSTRDEIKAYYEAYLEFNKAVYDKSNITAIRLNPGEVVCFNNRRFIHSRNGFKQPKGSRHFQGCYLTMEEFKSEVLALEYKLKNQKKDDGIDQAFDICRLKLWNFFSNY
ncbi:gamma-butyrobetaine dioxygenase-like isoform X1 [Brachionus plicatilis]|uniref:Gamma-butyrobetaine dioxygenase-like isoform X1 n=1 Tax=Brachionus plicatilis TaxID=10195 RepID=A0A3M7QZW9_BRAPC|nr:gamma-butyrobetaine dioxygenase-like isoform X1 [Brachionus plicatilis]